MRKQIAAVAIALALGAAPASLAQTQEKKVSFDAGWLLNLISTIETNMMVQPGFGTALDKLDVHATLDQAWRLVTVAIKPIKFQLNAVHSTAFRDDSNVEMLGLGTTVWHRKTVKEITDVTGAVLAPIKERAFVDWSLFANLVVRADKAIAGKFDAQNSEVHCGLSTRF